MTARISLLACASLLVFGYNMNIVQSQQNICPGYCFCYQNFFFFNTIHFVADCSNNDLILEDKHKPFLVNTKLNQLLLSQNKIEIIRKSTFAELPQLMDIDLSYNLIESIDPESFVDNANLITIRLQNNPLKQVEGPFLHSYSLRILHLENCNITEISPQFFSKIPLLRKLNLSGNPLKIIVKGIFDPLYSLRNLILNNCDIIHIYETAFNGLTYLQSLELAGNKINVYMNWPVLLNNLHDLQYLDLSKTSITNLPENVFINNNKLTILVLANNTLPNLNLATTLGHKLLSLIYIDLSYCHLRGKLLAQDTSANVQNVKALKLSGNHIHADDIDLALVHLVNIEQLSLQDCGLITLPMNTLHKLNNLQELDISKNELFENFAEFMIFPLESLKYLNMGYINFRTINKRTFMKTPNLKTLILSGNEFHYIEPGSFQNFGKLKVLELNNCGLRHLNSSIFQEIFTYLKLEELNVSNNPLEIPEVGPILPFQLSGLKKLDLSRCNISKLPVDAFLKTLFIEELLLNNNKLKNDNKNALKFVECLTNLKRLDLSYNNIVSIQYYKFSYNYQLTSLILFGNPIKCDCHIIDLVEWATSSNRSISMLLDSKETYFYQEDNMNVRYLTCYVDIKFSPIKLRSISRAQSTRTWGWYMHESSCISD